jgi:hypothetical protein
VVQPSALKDLTQLQLLSLDACPTPCPFTDVLNAVSKLTLLTELRVYPLYDALADLPAEAFEDLTALTASIHLCCLQLGLPSPQLKQGDVDTVLFKQGMQYQGLRLISLHSEAVCDCMFASNDVLQQLCSCCPAVESLTFAVNEEISTQGLQYLHQLPALTHLEVYDVGALAASTVVFAAAQLTGLKSLRLQGFTQPWQVAQPLLLQLTALVALEQLEIKTAWGYNWTQLQQRVNRVKLQNKVCLQQTPAAVTPGLMCRCGV